LAVLAKPTSESVSPMTGSTNRTRDPPPTTIISYVFALARPHAVTCGRKNSTLFPARISMPWLKRSPCANVG
jgi:hypothetical protein